jgi:hypothetical protein
VCCRRAGGGLRAKTTQVQATASVHLTSNNPRTMYGIEVLTEPKLRHQAPRLLLVYRYSAVRAASCLTCPIRVNVLLQRSKGPKKHTILGAHGSRRTVDRCIAHSSGYYLVIMCPLSALQRAPQLLSIGWPRVSAPSFHGRPEMQVACFFSHAKT